MGYRWNVGFRRVAKKLGGIKLKTLLLYNQLGNHSSYTQSKDFVKYKSNHSVPTTFSSFTSWVIQKEWIHG